MTEETARVHRRLDQIEHLLRQHQVRQNNLAKAVEEFRVFKEQTLQLADQLKAAKGTAALADRLAALEAKGAKE